MEDAVLIEDISIRRYEQRDNDDIWLLHRAALGDMYQSGAWEDDLKDIQKNYIDNNGEFLVVELDAKIIAMGAFRKINSERAEIKRMRVDPQFWRRGIGQFILSKLELLAKEKGYRMLQLDTTIIQEAAQKLYTKNMYKEFKRDKVGPFNCIFYEKKI